MDDVESFEGSSPSRMPKEEMKLYSEASAFEGAAVVCMIERQTDCGELEEKVLQITMEDGITLELELDSAERRLNELGYRQELKRSLYFPELYAVGISFMTVFAGILPTYGGGLSNGGPAGLIWYWWITAFFVHLIGVSMAEISSSFPTAGSLYFWAAALAGPKYGPIASFITGWMELFGLAVCNAMVSYGGTTILQVLILISTGGATGGGFLLNKYELFAIACLFVLLCFLINCLPVRHVATAMVASSAIQVLAAVALIVMLPLVAPTHQPAEWVFKDFSNSREVTRTPSGAYSFILALTVSQYSLYGYDCVAHLTEETRKSDRAAPVAIVSSLSTVTLLAWLLLVVLTWSIQSVDQLFAADSVTGGLQPVIQILWDAFYLRFGSGIGAQIFTVIFCISFFGATMSCQLGASRVAYALARDGGLPFSSVWRKLTPQRVPRNAVLLSVVIGIVFLLPVLSSPTLFYALASISTIAWVSSYAIPIFFRFIQKEELFTPGPFYMPRYIGVAGGKIVHLLAFSWIVYTMVVFNLPTLFPITLQNFNWAPVAIFIWMFIFLTWWFVHARFWFKGPIREVLISDEMSGGIDVSKVPISKSY